MPKDYESLEQSRELRNYLKSRNYEIKDKLEAENAILLSPMANSITLYLYDDRELLDKVEEKL